ncbi:MAG: aspartate carbamoyltransferase catalytic subunit [Phycisphaerales bacterium]
MAPRDRTPKNAARPGKSSHWPSPHVLALQDAKPADIRALLHLAVRCIPHAQPGATPIPALYGRTVANLFLEDSTRTRLSFTLAARRLGAITLDLTASASSVNKGESLHDTAKTLVAMGAEAVVIRHSSAGAALLLSREVDACILNAGDGRHEHPTQGLLDVLAIGEAFDRLDSFDFRGLRIAIIGDLANSRVARSDIAALTALGATVVCAGPPALAPKEFAALGCTLVHDPDEALEGAHAVQMLRVQLERAAAVGSLKEYADSWQLTPQRAARLGKGAIIMHPGPMNRGVEIHPSVADSAQARMERQVALGVPVRMACLLATFHSKGLIPASALKP